MSTVSEQIKAEDERSAAEFRRTERKQIYSEWLSVEAKLARSEGDVRYKLPSGGDPARDSVELVVSMRTDVEALATKTMK